MCKTISKIDSITNAIPNIIMVNQNWYIEAGYDLDDDEYDSIHRLNLEDYLKSLPDNTKYIDISERELTTLPDLSRFTNLTELDCSLNKLTILPPLIACLKNLNCSYNKLMCLPPLPEKLEKLVCSDNLLTVLPSLNKKLVTLWCAGNQLTQLPALNRDLVTLWCAANQLTKIPNLNPDLLKLWCSDNQLTSLPRLNLKLQSLVCDTNRLTSIPNLTPNLTDVRCFNNPIFKTVSDPKLNIMRRNIQTLNRFKELYYCVKYKTQFRYLLWVKVREPKIQQQYHPDNLTKRLLSISDDVSDDVSDDNDLFDVILNDW